MNRQSGTAVKTVLLITNEATHRHLYESGLKRRFHVRCAKSPDSLPVMLDAVVYDMPKRPSAEEFKLLKQLGVPVVILAPEKRLIMPRASKQIVLERWMTSFRRWPSLESRREEEIADCLSTPTATSSHPACSENRLF